MRIGWLPPVFQPATRFPGSPRLLDRVHRFQLVAATRFQLVLASGHSITLATVPRGTDCDGRTLFHVERIAMARRRPGLPDADGRLSRCSTWNVDGLTEL